MELFLSAFARPGRVRGWSLAAMATAAVTCLAAFPASAEPNTAAPNSDLGASVSGTPRPGSSALAEAARARTIKAYGNLPISFEVNRGQTDAQVDFLSRGGNYSLFLTSTGAVAVLRNGTSGGSSVLRMTLLGGNPRPPVEGQEALPGKSNYLIGNDPAQWRSEIPTFGRVKYGNIWPGIDLAYHGNRRQLEYDFIVAPHANPNTIKLGFAGARKMRVDRNGDLVLQLPGGELRTRKPLAYQEVAGVKSIVTAGYVVTSRNKVGIRLGAYDPSLALVIDPTVAYSTYLGNQNFGQGIAVDAAGNAYVTGYTLSTDFPTTAGAFQPVKGDSGSFYDAFVTKLDPAGSALVYSTYLGGGNNDVSYAIAVDDAGAAYVTGYTFSSDFPITAGAFQTTFVGLVDAFVTKLNPAGSALVYSTYLGGGTVGLVDANTGYGIAVDTAGEAYVTGATNSPTFPVTPGAFQKTNGCGGCEGGRTVFVTKLNAAGSGLVYSTYLGGSGGSWGQAIALDNAGDAYVTGYTSSSAPMPFPTTAGAFQPANGGFYDAFVTKLNPIGTGLVYSTYLGGSSYDQGNGIAVDDAGNAYVTGWTNSGGGGSTNFPTTAGAFQTTYQGNDDAFVAKINPAGSGLVYSTYLGGSFQDFGQAIAVDAAGNAYVTGYTFSTDFPTKGAFQPVKGDTGGISDVFVTKFNPAGFLLYSTYLGGNSADVGYAIAVDAGGNAYVTGYTDSSDFPTTAAAFQPAKAAGHNAFVTKFSLKPPVCCGDFNGDGKADILWRNASGEVYEWLLNGTNIIGEGSPDTVGNHWQIAGVGDFNGDGKTDILWRNTASGEVDVWLMNGTSVIGSGSPGTVGNHWQIARRRRLQRRRQGRHPVAQHHLGRGRRLADERDELDRLGLARERRQRLANRRRRRLQRRRQGRYPVAQHHLGRGLRVAGERDELDRRGLARHRRRRLADCRRRRLQRRWQGRHPVAEQLGRGLRVVDERDELDRRGLARERRQRLADCRRRRLQWRRQGRHPVVEYVGRGL